jgi:hypothetical protein
MIRGITTAHENWFLLAYFNCQRQRVAGRSNLVQQART